ncbi:hypothetical protein [Polymorphospora sp. A560]|uniref:hypothetical protein n=1 Tax=Polymorphospora sp. A560 TaxID=3040203 RepID=UPI003891F914
MSIDPPRQLPPVAPPQVPPPGGWPAPAGAPPAPRPRRWLIAVGAAWAVVLLVLAYVSTRTDEPTVREQRGMAEAGPLADRVIGELVAAGGTDVVAQLTPIRYRTGCRITPIRSGATLERGVAFRTTEADAPALLDRIADRLPPTWRAGTRHSEGGTVHSLRADAGDFVGVRGGVTSPGVITLTVSTGCRPTSDDYDPTVRLAIGLPVDTEPGRMLAAIGVTAAGGGGRESATCPGGGQVHTAWATGTGTPTGPLGDALAEVRPADAVVVTDAPDGYAYRAGDTGVEVRVVDGEVRATVTIGC